MSKILIDLLQKCSADQNPELITFLESQPDIAIGLMQELLRKSVDSKEQFEKKERILSEQEAIRNRVIGESFLHLPLSKDQSYSLEQEFENLKEACERFKAVGFNIRGMDTLQEIVHSMAGHPELDDNVCELIALRETPRSLGFKRGPSISRIEKHSERRIPSFCEALALSSTFLMKALVRMDDHKKLQKNDSLFLLPIESVKIPTCELLSIKERVWRIVVKMEILPSLKRVRFDFSLYREDMNINLDNEMILLFSRNHIREGSLGRDYVPQNSKFYENTFFNH